MKIGSENKLVAPHMHRAGGWCEQCVVRPADDRPSIDADPDVRRAGKAHAAAQAAYDEADAAWIDSVQASRSATLKAQNSPMLFDFYGSPIIPAAAQQGVFEAQNLESEAAALRQRRDAAGKRLTEARSALDDVTRRARWRVERK